MSSINNSYEYYQSNQGLLSMLNKSKSGNPLINQLISNNEMKYQQKMESLGIGTKSGNDKYNNIRIGMNSRLDTLQAAILIPKFKAFKEYELADVNKVAELYTQKLLGVGFVLPSIPEDFVSSWAQYTIQLGDNVDRSHMQSQLKAKNIPTMVYYAKPMHLQGAFENTYSAQAECPVTEMLCNSVLSLPLHPYMTEEMVDEVVSNLILSKNI